ncbi:hypothetical protein JQC92_07285 [Shewanella sp. 202IG2-18]|uniref:putative Ig domain-containing protein n=1 Tax=Parashewanella hymeniacidonis TaxID=2807618 RepID=UPI00195FA87F|nr:Ig-like domain-containing protein [Parashewanella hymeniacidonis]MBM7071844.1 hypothetical protein [Parashewanella hymeniacidonis]
MEFKFRWQQLTCASLISLTLAACGGSDDKKPEPPVPLPVPVTTNAAPTITSLAPTTATEDIEYSYTLAVTDPDDDQSGLTFTLNNAPDGMSVSDTGIITWTPAEGILTSGEVSVSVADGGEDGASAATESFMVTVTPVNDAPQITAEFSTAATEDILYQQQIAVSDSDDENNGTDIVFALVDAPEGMQVSETGLITWTATEGILSSGVVTVEVRDGGEDGVSVTTQALEITVTPVNDAPMVAMVEKQFIETGQQWRYQLDVADVDDTNIEQDINFELITAPSGLEISDTGLLTITASAQSTHTYTFVVRVSDGGEDGVEPVDVSIEIEEQVFVRINGQARNYFNGDQLADTTLRASEGLGVLSEIVSDETGQFSFKIQDIHLAEAERITLSAKKMGYAESAQTISPQEFNAFHNLLLQPVHASQSFDPTNETELMVEDFSVASIPQNSFVDQNGDAITSAVEAQITIINPELDIDLMPGDMVTVDENGEQQPIESFGAITVTFNDEQGNNVEFNGSEPATIRIPATGNALLRPETIPLYYYDSVAGVWVEEGEASLMTNGDAQYYQGTVSHFTTWNADIIYETIYIRGCVVDSDGTRIEGARLTSEGRNYLGTSDSFTDADGNFTLPVRIDSTVLISAISGSQSRTFIQSTAREDITLEACIVLSDALTKMTLTWGETPTDLDSHLLIRYGENAFEHVYFGNTSVVIQDTVIHLDVDDVTSYGPEVISIPQFPVAGKYEYIIHNYSGRPMMDPASTRTEIIFNNELIIMQPPADGVKRYWHVLDINVDDELNATIEVKNEWLDDIDDGFVPQARAPELIPRDTLDAIVKGLINSKYYNTDK